MDGAGHCRLHGRGPVARSDPEARLPTSLHCRLCRLVRQGGPHQASTRIGALKTHQNPKLGCSLMRASAGKRFGSARCAGRSFFLSACFALRRAPRPPARKNNLPSAHTDDRRTNDATCGPQEWLTGTLHEGGIRSVRSPPRRPPLLATPIAKPLQCGQALTMRPSLKVRPLVS